MAATVVQRRRHPHGIFRPRIFYRRAVSHLGLVMCGAPLAARAHEVAAVLAAGGWQVHVIGTRSALRWADAAAIERVTGEPVLTEQRRPDEPKRFPVPAAVLLCPATFNTVNKVAAGIADDYPTGFVCEAVASRVPTVLAPVVGERLWGHPAWAANLDLLGRAGVRFADVHTGLLGEPVPAGGELPGFDPAWAGGWFDAPRKRSGTST
jgi:phosphopantothenoylcysteine synthetase/decarboxylase